MNIRINRENKKLVNEYYETKYNTINNNMVINIPKINLEMIVRKADNEFKNLDKGLIYYKNNDYNKTIIILGHSGIGYGVYFNRINELDKEDIIYLCVNDRKITYKISQIYLIDKSEVGILNIKNESVLLLITCYKYDKNKRLVVKSVVKSD